MTAAVTALVRLAVQFVIGYAASLAISLGLPAFSSSVRDTIIGAITVAIMGLLTPVLNAVAKRYPWLGHLTVAHPGKAPVAAAGAKPAVP